jgi:formylglycine-generating enzyme required for sulfatase activity
MVSLPGGSFQMGSNTAEESDQKPRHLVRLRPFRIDRYEVTNRQFQMFVRETKYQTAAERLGWSYVFDFERKSWVRMVGACWWNPSGKNPHGGSESAMIAAMYDDPAVHVSWDDAQAFCRWSGKRLPSEAEWEYAAKGGLIDAPYPWGTQRQVNGVPMANYWQGWYPNENSAADGFLLLAPVGSFPANRYGLYDMGGNAWEWCGDRYRADYYRRCPLDNPLGPAPEEGEAVTVSLLRIRKENGRYTEEEFEGTKDVSLRIIRGGSFLSAENGDAGYRTAARGSQPQPFSFQDTGFRCAESTEPSSTGSFAALHSPLASEPLTASR